MLLKKNIPFSYVFGKVKYELVTITLYASLIAVLYDNYHLTGITIPIAVPTILGTVISLLLGFRSNQAYDRWWEARHIWGGIVNDSRTLARQIMTFVTEGFEETGLQEFKNRMIYRQIAWTYSLGNHLRGQSCNPVLEKYLSKEDQVYASSIDNIPSALLDLMGQDLKQALERGYINRFQQVELDRTLSRLCDSMGKAERIKNTVFPSTYSLYIHLALLFFIALLPFSVIEYFGLFEVPLVIAISTCFLLIEKMAIHLQDPFENKPTDTPMTTIAQNIEKNLKQLYNLHQTPKKFTSGNDELVRVNGKEFFYNESETEKDSALYESEIKKPYYIL